MPALNKKILCFIDECGTAGQDGFALGCVVVWAHQCGRLDKTFTELLPDSVNEVHASNWARGSLQGTLGRLASHSGSEGVVMVNKLIDVQDNCCSRLYARALVDTVKLALGRFAKQHQISGAIGNVEVIVDANHHNTSEAFKETILSARGNGGRFSAVSNVVPLNSAASRVLQLADVVAYARRWLVKGEENAKRLADAYGISVF